MNLSLPGWFHSHAPMSGQVPRMRWRALHDACEAVREGRFDDARLLLVHDGELAPTDAPCLNLFGVLALAHGEWDEAARLWRRALHADRTYVPAKRNLRRYFELFQFGRSNIPIALGDEPECFIRSWDES